MYEPWTRDLARIVRASPRAPDSPARRNGASRLTLARTLGIAAAAVVLVVAVVTVVDPASGARPRTITLQARSVLDRVQAADSAPAGESAGDAVVFTGQLLDDGGRQIGSDAASCTRLFDTRLLCTGAYLLDGGQVVVSLVQPNRGGALTYTQAITGGTGRYARATGTVVVRQQAGGDRFTFRIRLSS